MPPSLHVASSWRPSEDDVRSYEERGWFVTPALLPDGLLDATREAILAHQAGRRDRELAIRDGYSDWRPQHGDGVRNNEFCSLQTDGVRELALQPLIGAIAARLARTREIRLFDDQAVHKPAGAKASSAVGWHTDHSYWSTCTSERMLTAWIPLQDSDEHTGTLSVADGSHRWPESEHVRGFNDPDLGSLGRRLGRPVPEGAVVPLVVRKGQISFHHMRTLHASPANRGPSERFALAVHLQDADNRHRDYAGADGAPIVLPHDRLCSRGPDGRPDYTDPRTFPVLWSADREGSRG